MASFKIAPIAHSAGVLPIPFVNMLNGGTFMRPFALFLLSSTALSMASSAALADAAEEVVVTATRTPQPITQVGSSISLIDAAEIERRQIAFVADALATLPGVTVNRNGPFGGVASVRLRGMRSEQTLVLIDGIVVNDPSSPSAGFNFATLDPNDVERIEVLRGAQSTLYGSDAIGGVVNIITKRGQDKFGLRGFAEGGAYETLRGGLTVRGRADAIDYHFSASGITSNGNSKADVHDGNTEKDGYDDVTVSGNVGVELADNLRLEGLLRYTDSATEYDSFGFITGVTDGDEESTAKELVAQGRAILKLFDDRLENIVSVGYSDIDRDYFTDGIHNFGAVGKRQALEYQGNLHVIDEVLLTLGAKSEEVRLRTDTEHADITTNSVYAQLQVRPMDALNLVGGVRVDDHETFGSTTTARFAAAYNIAAVGTTLRASWGEGFKAPTPFQLTFFCCGAPGPNADLEPEETNGWDAGIEQSFLNDKASVSVTYFYQKTHNLIDFVFPDGYVNIARTRSKGVEATLKTALGGHVTVDGSFTHTLAIDRASDMRLVGIPKNAASVSVTVRPIEPLSVAVDGRYVGNKTGSWGVVDHWLRIDLRAGYKVTDKIEVYGRIENLFDVHYQEVFGFGTPGISAYGGVRATY